MKEELATEKKQINSAFKKFQERTTLIRVI